ncbi:MAG: UbiA family prenyltransferase, partial [Paludibacteraceae bacterium]|nr:UbiA family prenyltransferase [Paludibacteraceae bacterium]
MRLVRWSNLLFLAALIWLMEKWVAVPILDKAAFGEQLPWYIVLLLMLATVLIAAGGYVINDYFDVKIDRINHPDEVIVTRSISKPTAMRLSIILSGIGIGFGIVLAILLRSMTFAILFIIIPGLLWFYSSSYKRLFMIGNLIISLLAALTPMIVAMANVAILQLRYATILPYTTLVHDLYAWLGGFALFAFLLTWVRE